MKAQRRTRGNYLFFAVTGVWADKETLHNVSFCTEREKQGKVQGTWVLIQFLRLLISFRLNCSLWGPGIELSGKVTLTCERPWVRSPAVKKRIRLAGE
jgi:hypothetical protein